MRTAMSWWVAVLTVSCFCTDAVSQQVSSSRHPRTKRRSVRDVFNNDSGGHFLSRQSNVNSPHDLGLRASPPLEIPAVLIESKNTKYDPRPVDLNITALRLNLGSDFNPKYMSIHRPKNPWRTMYSFPFGRKKDGRLVAKHTNAVPKWLRQFKFQYVRLPDGTKAATSISRAKFERKLKNFLWAYTSCPVVYKWRDLGSRFWPRWVNEGHCPGDRYSCSIPPGMRCRMEAFEYIILLRWYCDDWQNPARKCHWLRVHYPIVTKCTCGCSYREEED